MTEKDEINSSEESHSSSSSDSITKSNTDVHQEQELDSLLFEMSNKYQQETYNKVLNQKRQMSEIWSPHIIPLLKKLHSKGVDLSAMRQLFDATITEKDTTKQYELLTKMISEQEAIVLEAIGEVTDVKRLERLVNATTSLRNQFYSNSKSVLSITGRKED